MFSLAEILIDAQSTHTTPHATQTIFWEKCRIFEDSTTHARILRRKKTIMEKC